MKRVLVREEMCIGCGLCRVVCEAHHAGNDDLVKALKNRASRVGGIRIEQNGPRSVSVRCRQCAEPACVEACITGAMHRLEDNGPVLVDSEKCIGCGTCTLVCPLGAVHIDQQTGKAIKCDGCHDRDVPRCVSVCPNGSLVTLEMPPESISATARKSPNPLLV